MRYNLSFVIKSFRGRSAAGRRKANMPIYEYRCASCGHELEALQRLADAPWTECPACHKTELKKLLSAAGFQLKGSGWYATDFRNSGAKPPAKEKPAGGDAAAGGNGKGAGSATAPGGHAHTARRLPLDWAVIRHRADCQIVITGR